MATGSIAILRIKSLLAAYNNRNQGSPAAFEEILRKRRAATQHVFQLSVGRFPTEQELEKIDSDFALLVTKLSDSGGDSENSHKTPRETSH